MSLILDALKRAERERKLGQAPAALEEVAPPPPPPPGKPSRRGLVLTVVAVAVAALAGFAWFRADQDASPAAQEIAVAAEVAPPAAATVVQEAAPEPTPVEDLTSARIEDGGDIASLDDLTGEIPGDAEPVADGGDATVDAEVVPVTPVAPGPTLYTPSLPPERSPPPAPAPAPVAAPKRDVAVAQPVPTPSPAPAPAPIVLEPAPELVAAAAPVEPPTPPQPRVVPSGPVVHFGSDGSARVTPAPERPRPEPVIEAPTPVPAPTIAPAAEVVEAAPAPPPAPIAVVEPPAPAPAPVVAKPVPAPAPPPAPTIRQPPPPSPAIAGLRRLKDMPSAYRAEFPALSVDVHVYNADPQRRFVLVNGKRYREGDPLAEGPRIAEIVPDGMIIEWRNEKIVYTLNR